MMAVVDDYRRQRDHKIGVDEVEREKVTGPLGKFKKLNVIGQVQYLRG